MVEFFIIFVHELERVVYKSELWNFFQFQSIPPWVCQNLSSSEIFELVTVFNLLSSSGETHMKRVAYYAAQFFPLHRFCLYAHRYSWKEIYNINTWIKDKYSEYFGYFSHSR